MDMNYKEKATGTEYKMVQKFWWGEDYRCVSTHTHTQTYIYIYMYICPPPPPPLHNLLLLNL